MTEHFEVLIVGGGQAGGQCATHLREGGFAGNLAIVGLEREAPYERPPLSKEYLSGERPFEQLLVRQKTFWLEQSVRLNLGDGVVAVDPGQQQVETASGRSLSYDHLVWATGCEPRRLGCAGADLLGVHVLRTKAHVDAILADLGQTSRVAIIGGGYIGLEAAAVLKKMGRQVTVFEAQNRVLARVTGVDVSRFYEAEHARQGVTVRTSVCVARIIGHSGRAVGVELSDGSVESADLVIVGIGVDPVIGQLKRAGAEVSNGVHVDDRCRTTLRNVYAIGDCAAAPNSFAGGQRVRLESYQNANEMAQTAAAAILGVERPVAAVAPWFWSNQYDLQLQSIGLPHDYEETLLRGDPETGSFTVGYLKEGRLLALDCINMPRDYMQGRGLVGGRSRPNAERFKDPSIPLRQAAAV